MARVDDIMKLLQAQLKLVLPAYTQAPGSNSGNPTLTLSQSATPTAGQENAFIQLQMKTYSGFPTISLASSVDGRPDVLQIVVEADATTAARSVWTEIDWALFAHEAMAMNVEIELYIRANGSVPVLTDITSGNLVGRVLADPRHPNVGM